MMRNRRRRILEQTIVAVVGFASCVSCTANPKKQGVLRDALTTTPPQATGSALASTGVRGAVQPLGSIPYDGFTLPVIAPDGRHFAVQGTGGATISARLASPQAPLPRSQITQYRIEANGLLKVAESEPGLLLGRGASFAGCLCEGPRPGGGRAIGVLPWGENEVEWIVDDGRANAFASLAPDATLAWCARDAVGGAWSLAIRMESASDDLVIPPPEGGSWLYPVAVSRHCVCALLLRDGVASFAQFDPSDAPSTRRTPTLSQVSDRMDIQLASQMFAPQQGLDALTPGGEVLYFNPATRAIAAWNPKDGNRVSFPGQPIAICFFDRARIAALSGDEVRLRSVDNDHEPGVRLIDGVAVPRRLPGTDGRQGILFVAPEAQSLRLSILRPSS